MVHICVNRVPLIVAHQIARVEGSGALEPAMQDATSGITDEAFVSVRNMDRSEGDRTEEALAHRVAIWAKMAP